MPKVQRYTFMLKDECEMGTPKDLTLRMLPDKWMLAQQIIIRPEVEGMYELEDIILDGQRIHTLSSKNDRRTAVMVMQPGHVSDPFIIRRHAEHPWMWLDSSLTPGVRIGPHSRVTQVTMSYTGKIPPGMGKGQKFDAWALFMGEASDGH